VSETGRHETCAETANLLESEVALFEKLQIQISQMILKALLLFLNKLCDCFLTYSNKKLSDIEAGFKRDQKAFEPSGGNWGKGLSRSQLSTWSRNFVKASRTRCWSLKKTSENRTLSASEGISISSFSPRLRFFEVGSVN